MTRVPVFCDNRRCNRVWFSNTFVHIEGGSHVHLTANKTGPCPDCGSDGSVADAVYSEHKLHLLRIDQIAALEKELQEIKTLVESNALEQEVSKRIAESTWLKKLSPYMPKNGTQLLKWVRTILDIIKTFMLAGVLGTAGYCLPDDVNSAIDCIVDQDDSSGPTS